MAWQADRGRVAQIASELVAISSVNPAFGGADGGEARVAERIGEICGATGCEPLRLVRRFFQTRECVPDFPQNVRRQPGNVRRFRVSAKYPKILRFYEPNGGWNLFPPQGNYIQGLCIVP